MYDDTMDTLIGGESLSWWLLHWGSLALFCFLIFGILALPIPEETLMVIAGTMMHQGVLHIHWTILAAITGSMCGITSSYLLGRTAGAFLSKHTRWFGVTETHLKKVHDWFEKYGSWTLFFGYFVPGVRHFTGLMAGTAKLEYKRFALFAYGGAVVWTSTFLSIGYFLGNYFFAALKDIEINFDDILSIAIFIGICALIYYLRKKR